MHHIIIKLQQYTHMHIHGHMCIDIHHRNKIINNNYVQLIHMDTIESIWKPQMAYDKDHQNMHQTVNS